MKKLSTLLLIAAVAAGIDANAAEVTRIAAGNPRCFSQKTVKST